MKPITLEKLYWWLSLIDEPRDDQFTVARNVYYNRDKRIQTRAWMKPFWNNFSSFPVSSYYRRQTSKWINRAICFSWWSRYTYDEGSNTWIIFKSWLIATETITPYNSILTTYDWAYTYNNFGATNPTRWSFAVYQDVVYMCDWVNPYAYYDWTTYTEAVSVVWNVTFDYTTDKVNLTAHWLLDWTQVRFVSWTLPSQLTLNEVYFVVNKTTDDFQISLTLWWVPIDFTDNGSWTISMEKLLQPRPRFLRTMQERLYAAWVDASPYTVYYSNTNPVNFQVFDTNFNLVWNQWEWRITGLKDIWNVVLITKERAVYNIVIWDSVAVNKIDPINWWYSHRALENVENSLFYQTNFWVESLQQRVGVSWWPWLFNTPLTNDVRALTNLIKPYNLQYSVMYYNRFKTNVYYAFSTDQDSTLDTVLVYSTLTWSWTQYVLPALYDIWQYIDSNWEYHVIIASAQWWQLYEIETGFEDNGWVIESEIQSKRYYLWMPWTFKSFQWVDFIWKKSLWESINIAIVLDWSIVTQTVVTDDYLTDVNSQAIEWVFPLGTETIWNESIWWAWSANDIWTLYTYLIRVPIYQDATYIQWDFASDTPWLGWTLDRARIFYDQSALDLFYYANIG